MTTLSKTPIGQQAFKERSPLLSPRQRSAFILFDGVKTQAQVLAATAGLGVTEADVEHMLAQGFLAVQVDPDAITLPGGLADVATAAETALRTPQQRYSAAKPLATKITAALGLRGFMLNLSVESAAGYDDLLALLPKIQAAAGEKACRELEQALKG